MARGNITYKMKSSHNGRRREFELVYDKGVESGINAAIGGWLGNVVMELLHRGNGSRQYRLPGDRYLKGLPLPEEPYEEE